MRGPVPTALFLDRDGVLNRKAPEGGYVTSPDAFEWLPGVVESLALLKRHGVRLFVMTNQRGVARGLMEQRDLVAVHDRMRDDLAVVGVTLDGVYACVHEEGTCDCRKPRIGLFTRALAEHPGLDLSRSAVVGDSLSDIEAAARLGVPAYAIASGSAGDDVSDRAHERGLPIAGRFSSLASLVTDGFGMELP